MAIDYTKYHNFTADNAKVFEDVRFILKNDELATWQNSTGILEKGEIALARVNVTKPDGHGGSYTVPTYLMKVGDGANKFADLNWLAAPASDVHAWAKKATLDPEDLPQIPLNKLPTEGIDTDLDTRYTITMESDETNGDRIKVSAQLYSKGVASGEPVVSYIDVVSPAELSAALNNYYTKTEVDNTLAGKLHTEDEIKTLAATEIGRLIDASGDAETLKSIGDLVDYAEKNAGDIAQLVTDVGTANTNASNAVTTAGEAKTTAEGAATTAGEAKTLATEAKEAAITAQNSAAASAAAAKADAEAAAAAKADAEAAKGAAETAAANAVTSEGNAANSATLADNARAAAVTAQGLAEGAKDAAVAAQGAAETAKGLAEDAKTAAAGSAEAAAGSAEAAATSETNAGMSAEAAAKSAEDAAGILEQVTDAATGAQATANEALGKANTAIETANGAKASADAATEAVAGLHAIAKSGSTDDLVQGTKTIVFNCGGAFNA